MRISDWSSDLCSSDLRWLDIRESGIDNAGLAENVGHMLRNSAGLLQGAARHHFNIDLAVIGVDGWLKLEGKRHEGHYRGCKRAAATQQPCFPDRKSVGQGKRVSVRVDRGGRRSIKKKNT